MKTNGIIRRVDNLGRVVIPREYRKFHKIALGDPMEIVCHDDGEIVLKKIDMTLTLEEFAMPAVKLLAQHLGSSIIVSNLSEFICGAGAEKNQLIGSQIPYDIKLSLADRKSSNVSEIPEKWGITRAGEKKSLLFEPIIGESDIFGGLFAISDEQITDTEAVLLKITAAVIGSSLQKY